MLEIRGVILTSKVPLVIVMVKIVYLVLISKIPLLIQTLKW